MPSEEYHRLFSFSRKVALAIRKVIPCKRIALSVVGLEVPHAHIHLIPINTMDDVRFQKKVNISDSEMQKIANSIAQNFKPLLIYDLFKRIWKHVPCDFLFLFTVIFPL